MGIVGDIGHKVLTGKEFFTSDTHFFHNNVIKYCNRPYCCRHSMNEDLISRWNDSVKPSDIIYVLGDFAFGSKNKFKRILERLNGYKILVKGNHDPGRNNMSAAGFDEVYLQVNAEWNGKTVFMQHVPDKNVHQNYDIHLCGHVHQHWCKTHNIINVGVDVWDLRPQTLDYIIENADKIQASLPVQNTLEGAWEDRNDQIIKKINERIKNAPEY